MILARVAPENVPRSIFIQDVNDVNVQEAERIHSSDSEQNISNDHQRQQNIRCCDIRPMVSGGTKFTSGKGIFADQISKFGPGNSSKYDFSQIDGSNKNTLSFGEGAVEELWVVGDKKVEWRKGGKTVKVYSGQNLTLQALWTSFISDCKTSNNMEYVVIRERERLRVYSEGGQEYFVALPYALRKVWNTKFGLLLEKSGKTNDNTTAAYSSHAGIANDYEGYRIKPPKLMALHHPLDDLTRIVIKREIEGKKKFSEWNSNRHTILFTSPEPSICLTFDNVTGYHNIWHIRQIYESDEFTEDLLENSLTEMPVIKTNDTKKDWEMTPTQQLNSQAVPPTLFSNLLNNTRLKQFHKKQNTPSSGIPSASGSPLLSSHYSPNSSKPTPNISANSCVMQQQRSQNSSSINTSLSGITGTSTRRHTPVTSNSGTGPFNCADSPLLPQNQAPPEVAATCSTREFMIRQGTPIRVSNPNVNMNNSKQHQMLHHGTPSSRLVSFYNESQNPANMSKPHVTPLNSNNATNVANNRFMSSRDCDNGGTEQPLAPDFSICLDLIWSEENDSKLKRPDLYPNENTEGSQISTEASKVFIYKDIIGTKYLCMFHKSRGIINILPYNEVKGASGQPNKFIFEDFGQIGSMHNSHGKKILDCAPIETEGMILTLEKTRNSSERNSHDNSLQSTNICLYTGSVNDNKVADVHIEPFYSSIIRKGDLANIAHEISVMHLDGKQLSTNEKGILTCEKMPIDAAEYGKKGVITSSRPTSATGFQAFNESILTMLSPVSKSDQNLVGFPAMLPNSLCKDRQLEPQNIISKVEYGAYSQAKLFHNDLRLILTMPPMCTSTLVNRCLKVLYAYLPNRLSTAFAIKWYRMRNAPGPSSISITEEWKLFVKCLFSQMGYRVDRLQLEVFSHSTLCRSGNDSSVSPVYSKKMRPDESGSDEDWQALLESKPHVQSGDKLSSILRIPDALRNPNSLSFLENVKDSKDTRDTQMDVEMVLIDSDAILFESIGSILWCMHLLYEDFKVEKTSIEYLSSMSVVLSKLAGDLNLVKFVEHYWQDFPTSCPKTIMLAQTGQMLPQYLPLVSRPFVAMKDGNSSLTTSHTTPPCIYSHLTGLLDGASNQVGKTASSYLLDRYEILENGATKRSCDIIIIYAILSVQKKTQTYRICDTKLKVSDYLKISKSGKHEETEDGLRNLIELVITSQHSKSEIDVASSIVKFVVDQGYNTWTLMNTFPEVVALPIFGAIFECRLNPRLKDSNWAKEAYELIGRPDLAKRCLQSTKSEQYRRDDTGDTNESSAHEGATNAHLQQTASAVMINNEPRGGISDNAPANTIYDGLEAVESEITHLRWPADRRLADVRRMLQSARPVLIEVEQRPEMSDHDFVEVQERALQSLCIRTMALPIGRGALGFRTTHPLPTETLPVPKLCLSGRAPPRGATVEMDHIDVVPNMERWPSFHNGVAAGLRIAIENKMSFVDSNWITFNKPKDSSTNPNELVEHGGFLMALGLNGQLAALGKLESFDYLIRGNDMISIGILLGTCAAKRGSMDILATKKIATQVEALLPSTATELPLSNTTQVAGLAGLGLLYQGTGHRQMAEVCLMELGRPPGPEMENCTDRESYSLSAGLALGMITLGKGDLLNKGSLSDLRLPETLYHHMVGGPRSPSVYRHRFRSPSSYQIQEGDTVNVDITSPGATLALGLMFFNSGNKTYANWMNAPDSQFLLEFVRPDFLMIRTLAKGLIMWDSILPNSAWIDSHVPSSIRPYCLRRPGDDISLPQNGPRGITGSIDYETINQAYCNIIAGAALAMGLRFAGSNNSQAFEVLHRITRRLLAISKRSVAELAGKATVEQTICVLVLSLAIVAAGSGDLEVVRIIRYLRSRVGPKNPTVTYGSHMALHLALGLLFLGGGRYTLSTSPEAVAAMVTAFFPKFPTHSNDNRYHLQALRHFYVLAAEPRLLIPRDIHSRRLVFSHVEIELKDTIWYKKCSYSQKAPVLLPELKYLKKVSIKDPRYHEILFNIDHHKKSDGNNFAQLQALFDEDFGLLDIQQKAGSLSYEDDPRGFRSLTGQCLTKGTHFRWNVSLDSSRLLSTFSLDPAVAAFTNIFISNIRFANSPKEKKIQAATIEQIMASILYECASQEKLDMLPFYIKIFQFIWDIGKPGQLLIGPQMAMLEKLTSQKHTECSGQRGLINRLVNPEIVTSIYQGLQYKFDFFLNHFGVKLAEGFLAHGKFDFGENLKNIKECSSEHGLGDEKNSTAFQEHAFASLLVMHQNMCQNQAESIKKLKFHSSKQNLNDQNSNLLKKILCNKNFNTE